MDYINFTIKKELALIARLFSQQISNLPLKKEGGDKDGYLYRKGDRNRIRC